MKETSKDKLLKMYASADSDGLGKRDNFPLIVIISLLFFASGGYYLSKNTPPPKTVQEKISEITTSFIMDEKPVIAKIIKEKQPDPPKQILVEKPEEPVDLTEKPILNQKNDDIVEQPKQQEQPAEQPKVVRRVYGLKKVYSTGIGAGGNAADAVIGKLGNTLNTEIDTFTATKEELKGQLVSITTVTSAPKLKVSVKPEYSKEMTENNIEGVVKVKVLVDVDGKVKRAIVMNDLGFGTKEKVLEAVLKLLFEPAISSLGPVAVWIIVPFNFKMLN